MTKLETDIRLLEGAIQHWRRMRKERGGKDEPTPGQCPLCKRYFFDGCCTGCPIAKEVGASQCWRTPYSKAALCFEQGGFLEWQDAADAEIAFLISLKKKLQAKLPKRQKDKVKK